MSRESKLCYRVSLTGIINADCTEAEETALVGIFKYIIKKLATIPTCNASFDMIDFPIAQCDSIKDFMLEIDRHTIHCKHYDQYQWQGTFTDRHKMLIVIGIVEKQLPKIVQEKERDK